MSDRAVHARFMDTEGFVEVVRYDRAGKWYIEPDGQQRRQVTLDAAAQAALYGEANGGWIKTGLPGGNAFDSRVRALDS